MKILILCDMFPPAFGPRMGYLCKYMKRAGWKPVVVTEQINDNTFSFLKEETPVTYVNFFRCKRKILQKLEWIYIFILDYFFHYKDKKMAKAASRLLEEGEYAGVLCSSYRAFPLPAARYVAEKYHLPLVIDLRDIVEQYASNEYIAHSFHTFPWLDRKITAIFRQKLLRDRNNALAKADQVTTISPWHVKELQTYNPNTELIYNGYDPEIFYPERHQTSQFVITYTGRLISLATRDPRLLFEAVSRLDREKLIDPVPNPMVCRCRIKSDHHASRNRLPSRPVYGLLRLCTRFRDSRRVKPQFHFAATRQYLRIRRAERIHDYQTFRVNGCR